MKKLLRILISIAIFLFVGSIIAAAMLYALPFHEDPSAQNMPLKMALLIMKTRASVELITFGALLSTALLWYRGLHHLVASAIYGAVMGFAASLIIHAFYVLSSIEGNEKLTSIAFIAMGFAAGAGICLIIAEKLTPSEDNAKKNAIKPRQMRVTLK